jgi:hypothetical protein
MVVLGPVPAKDGGNVVVRLDDDPAPASRPLARSHPDPVHVLPDVSMFTTGPLAPAAISATLVPEGAVRTTGVGKEQFDPVIAFLAQAPRVEFFQRVPLVRGSPFLPVMRDAALS